MHWTELNWSDKMVLISYAKNYARIWKLKRPQLLQNESKWIKYVYYEIPCMHILKLCKIIVTQSSTPKKNVNLSIVGFFFFRLGVILFTRRRCFTTTKDVLKESEIFLSFQKLSCAILTLSSTCTIPQHTLWCIVTNKKWKSILNTCIFVF